MTGQARSHPRRLTAALLGAALSAIGAGGGAHAAGYEVIRSSAEGVKVIDPAAAETVGAGPVRRVQIVEIRKSILSEGPRQPGYVATLTDYDCGQRRYRWRGVSAYSRSGQQLLHKDNADPAWTPIAGDFEATAAARILCEGLASGSVYTAESIGQLVSALMQAWDVADPAAALLEPPPPPAQPPPARKKPAKAKPQGSLQGKGP